MANISKINLPNNTTYTLKDNSQTRSNHTHYDSDLVPLLHKTYASTSYYGTTNNWENTSWYFMSVKPDNWYKPWRIKLKVHSYCPSYGSYQSYTWSTICGREASTIYANWNEHYSSAHSYITLYPLKKAGYDAGYGHAIAISIYNADSRTSSAYYRTFEIDYYDCENCTVTFLDTPVKWSSWPGTGTTNYGSMVSYDAISRGLQESGDSNTVTENRIGNFPGKTGVQGVWAGSLFMEDANGTYQNICTASDGTATASNRTTATTKIANTNGFKVLGTIWYCNTNYNANTNISGGSNVYSAISAFDSRYTFNTTLTANSLTPFKEVYLVGTIHDDGLFYLDTTWWTQTPNNTTKVYVLVGACWDSSTSYCRITLYEQNKWYRYNGTNLIEIANDARTVNGLTVQTAVPSGAVFTDTKNTAGSTDSSSKLFLIGATSQAANPQTYSQDTAYVDTNGHLYSNSKQVVNLSDTQALTNKTYNGYTLGTACAKSFDTTVTSGSSNLITSGAVATAIDNLPEPMIFKGTLGTGGTITSLPTAAASNEGYTYKVITAGTYASQAAKVGDVFVSAKPEGASAYSWILIPAGDTDSDTWRAIKVNGTQLLGSALSTGAVNFKNGTNVSISGSGNDITITATDTNTTYSLTQDSSDGHKITLTPSSGTAQTVTIPDNDTTYTAGTGLSLSGTEFSVKTGYTTSGNNRKVQTDSSGNLYVTQKDDNTTYSMTRDGSSVKLTPSSGTAQSIPLSDLINGLGEGTSPAQTGDYLVAQYAGGGTSNTGYYRRTVGNVVNSTVVKAALGTSSGTTKYLREDGTWQAPPDNNTTYTFANGTNGFTVTPSGGTAQTVTVTPSITNNITGSGTNGYIAKFNGANTITNGPAFGSTTTTYLNNAGSWATPPDTKNTAGSTDTSSKIFLVGATSQSTSPQTYSDNEVFATSGVLTTKSVQVGGGSATMQYNSTTQAIDFIFSGG